MIALNGKTGERIERIAYSPGLPSTGDLEGATKTITAVTEGAVADYSAALTLASPTEVRLQVKRIASRLAVVIDSMTAVTLYCRVYVDAQATNNRLFDLSWTTTGEKLHAVDTHAAALATIFNLLKDGAAHTFYFFFWVSAGNAVLSYVNLWETVGTCLASPAGVPTLSLNHQGFLGGFFRLYVLGSGTPVFRLCFPNTYEYWVSVAGSAAEIGFPSVVGFNPDFVIWGTVASDICYPQTIELSLRSET